MSSGVCERTGYSVAGAASNVLVVGCGAKMLGCSFAPGVVVSVEELAVLLAVRGPVRTVEGRICSKPCEAATASMDLKYCSLVSTVWHQRGNMLMFIP